MHTQGPRVDDMIDQMGRICYSIRPLSVKRMPFGLQGTRATFQRMVDRLIDGTGEFRDAYINDIIVYNQSREEYMEPCMLCCSVCVFASRCL